MAAGILRWLFDALVCFMVVIMLPGSVLVTFQWVVEHGAYPARAAALTIGCATPSPAHVAPTPLLRANTLMDALGTSSRCAHRPSISGHGVTERISFTLRTTMPVSRLVPVRTSISTSDP